ncbi:MAG TPA: DNA methyltransferase [Pyrinomonadaceae bacterium]
MKPTLDRLPDTIIAPRTDPIYNCHGYLTKVPVAAIEPFIETFSAPGEVIADLFAGSGMTGLAAVRLHRKARLSDISVLGRHIAEGYSTCVSKASLLTAASEVIESARQAVGVIYTTQRKQDGLRVDVVRTVWSFVYKCPSCGSELVYYEYVSRGAPPKICSKCSSDFVRRNWRRLEDVPVEIVVRNVEGRLTEQAVSAYDEAMIKTAAEDPRQRQVPSQVIDEEREMFSRSGLGKAGMVKTSDFFSARNAIALVELWKAINAVQDDNIRQKLCFAFTAILPRASRRYQWSAQRPLNAQNQTYYIAPVYYEWNVFELFNRKLEAALRADDFLLGNAPLLRDSTELDFKYVLASADNLAHLGTSSVDYVFTDPPFGSNIFYSDMNLFHEAWLGTLTDHRSEAVVHTTGRRKIGAAERYESLLRSAFSEAFRVLKPGRYMSVVFGNSSGRIWGLVQRAIREAGFQAAPTHVAILDKGQRSVKGLSSGSESVVTVDLILTVQKPVENKKRALTPELEKGDTAILIADALKKSGDFRNPSHLYAGVLRTAIKRHYSLDQLHLTDVLLALRKAGYTVDAKTGLLSKTNAA